jgi:hypothetical protein
MVNGGFGLSSHISLIKWDGLEELVSSFMFLKVCWRPYMDGCTLPVPRRFSLSLSLSGTLYGHILGPHAFVTVPTERTEYSLERFSQHLVDPSKYKYLPLVDPRNYFVPTETPRLFRSFALSLFRLRSNSKNMGICWPFPTTLAPSIFERMASLQVYNHPPSHPLSLSNG